MRRTLRALLAVALAGAALVVTSASPAHAAIANGGFEAPDITPSAYVQSPPGAPPTGWIVTPPVAGGSILTVKSPTFPVTEGTQAGNLSGFSPNIATPTSRLGNTKLCT